jgi:hypothetical protein
VNLRIVPVTFRQAVAFIAAHHRHNKPPTGMKFCIGVHDGEQIRGVATVGRPVSRVLDDGFTVEVNRTCTDGAPNANSMLYGAAWRAAKAMGYTRAITYTQDAESGASLKAAGWVKAKTLQRRGSWAESSQKLKHLRDPIGNGGVVRGLWEIGVQQ